MSEPRCPNCGKQLRRSTARTPDLRKWFCNNSECPVIYVLLNYRYKQSAHARIPDGVRQIVKEAEVMLRGDIGKIVEEVK
jgi:hypothetical protein